MNNEKISQLLLVSAAFLLILLVVAPSKSNEWRTEVVYEGQNPSFVQIEMKEGVPAIAYTTDNGTYLAKSQRIGIPVLGDIHEYFFSPGWNKETINASSSSGGYLSMEKFSGKLAVAYKESDIGDSKLVYSEKRPEGWNTEVVDSIAGTGLGSGMYASLTSVDGDPVILYHTSQDNQFVKAERTEDKWNRKVLDTDEGWFISTDSCGEKAFAVYRSRESEVLRKAVIDEQGFTSQNLSYKTNSQTAVDATDCTFRAGVYSSPEQEVVYLDGERSERVGDGRYSSVSMGYQENPKLTYYVQGEGLIYSERKPNKEWSEKLLDGDAVEYAGQYNDLELTSSGKPVVAYTTSSELKMATKDVRGYNLIRSIFVALISILLPLSVFFGIRSDEDYFSRCKNYIKKPR
jgi:hypothetical protein